MAQSLGRSYSWSSCLRKPSEVLERGRDRAARQSKPDQAFQENKIAALKIIWIFPYLLSGALMKRYSMRDSENK